MNAEEKDVIERLVRLETKVDVLVETQKEHNKRHYDFSSRSLFAVLSSLVAIFIALFRH